MNSIDYVTDSIMRRSSGCASENYREIWSRLILISIEDLRRFIDSNGPIQRHEAVEVIDSMNWLRESNVRTTDGSGITCEQALEALGMDHELFLDSVYMKRLFYHTKRKLASAGFFIFHADQFIPERRVNKCLRKYAMSRTEGDWDKYGIRWEHIKRNKSTLHYAYWPSVESAIKEHLRSMPILSEVCNAANA